MDQNTEDAGKCPVDHGAKGKAPNGKPYANKDWWPEHLDIGVLHAIHPSADPMGSTFNYAEEFKTLDLDAVIKDLHALMTDSKAWWPP